MTANPNSYLIILTAKGGGDRPPVVALACGLRDRGHRVTVLCDEETAKLIASTDLPTAKFPQELDERGHITNWIKGLTVGDPDPDLPNPMTEWANPLMSFSLEIVSDFKPDLIVSSLFGMGLANKLSKQTDTPWCFVNPSFYFGDHASTTWEDDWYGPFIPRLARDCFLPLVKQADIVLHATDPEFDFQPTQLPANHHYVGFLIWDPEMPETDLISESGDPWALITLSSVRQEDEVSFAQSALQALSNRPVRTLLTQPDKNIQDELGNIPANATITGFVPHTPILKKSSLVINHAGHGIVSKALYYGVPMVLLPWDRDQSGVAARAAQLGVAKLVPRAEANPERVAQAVDELFDNSDYLDAAKFHSERLQNIDSVGIACKLLEDM
jgi:UDP:flavonoid glycosyltransferase YjiC (YdhE family)